MKDSDLFFKRFSASDLGSKNQSVPWDDLVSKFNFKEQALGRSMLFVPN
jgi:hypothetical protein